MFVGFIRCSNSGARGTLSLNRCKNRVTAAPTDGGQGGERSTLRSSAKKLPVWGNPIHNLTAPYCRAKLCSEAGMGTSMLPLAAPSSVTVAVADVAEMLKFTASENT